MNEQQRFHTRDCNVLRDHPNNDNAQYTERFDRHSLKHVKHVDTGSIDRHDNNNRTEKGLFASIKIAGAYWSSNAP
eukprot:scaffold93403_cov18-Prasinocladus_malaysianus.AAC.1